MIRPTVQELRVKMHNPRDTLYIFAKFICYYQSEQKKPKSILENSQFETNNACSQSI